MKIQNRFTLILISIIISLSFYYLSACSLVKGNMSRENLQGPKVSTSSPNNLEQFFAGIRPTQGNPESHYLLARYYQERGKQKEAIDELKKVLSINRGYTKAYNGLGVSYDLLGDYTMAHEFYKAALALNAELDYVQNNLGYSFLLRGKFNEAISAFKKAIVLNGKEPLFHNNLGLAYAENGQFDLALAEWRLAGDEAKANFNVAEIYLKKKLYKEAQTHYKIALKLNPSYTVAWTTSKAAGSLARIFQTDRTPAEQGRLMVPQGAADLEIGKNASLDIKLLETQTDPVKSGTVDVDLTSNNQRLSRSIVPIDTERQTNSQPVLPRELKGIVTPEESTKAARLEPPLPDFIPATAQPPYEMQNVALQNHRNSAWEPEKHPQANSQAYVQTGKAEEGSEWDREYASLSSSHSNKTMAARDFEEDLSFQTIITKSAVEDARPKPSIPGLQERNLVRKVPAGKVGIEISNGNGVTRMASKIGEYLKIKGLKVKRLTNANNFQYKQSKIYFQEGHADAAQAVSRQLPKVQEMISVKKFDRADIQIKILLGKDLASHSKLFDNKGKS